MNEHVIIVDANEYVQLSADDMYMEQAHVDADVRRVEEEEEEMESELVK